MGFYKLLYSKQIVESYVSELLDRSHELRGEVSNSIASGPTAVGDFNGDGFGDLVYFLWEDNQSITLTEGPTLGQMIFLQGTKSGKFVDATDTLENGGVFDAVVRKVRVGDFNGDGIDDIIPVINREDGRTGDGNERAAQQLALFSGPDGLRATTLGLNTWGHGLSSGDLNGDGRLDWLMGGFTNDTDGKQSVVCLQQADGSFTQFRLSGIGDGASAIGDFDGDGQAELVDSRRFYVDGLPSDTGLQTYTWNGTSFSEGSYYSEGPFVRLETMRSWNGELGKAIIRKDVNGEEYIDGGISDFAAADIAGDGIDDLIAVKFGSTLGYVDGILDENGGEPLGHFEFFSANEDGDLEKKDFKVAGWMPPRYGMQDFKMVDWDGDGHLDIVAPWPEFTPPDYDFTGVQILINDGTGNFARLEQSKLPKLEVSMWTRGIPVDANGDGIMDIMYTLDNASEGNLSQWQDQQDQLYLGTQRIFAGPDYKNPALKGAAGFNETYYLNQHPGVAALVDSGEFASGLAHYLKIGRAQGFDAFAAGTHVYGSKNGDKIVLREGNETAEGLAGRDVLNGGEGDDVLSGGKDADKFVFGAGDGDDVILDFSAKGTEHDVIDLSGNSAFTSFKDLKTHHLAVIDGSVVIADGAGATIRLAHVTVQMLSASDFLL